MRRLVLLVLLLAATPALADPKSDITSAFTAFVDSLATDKPALEGVQAVLPPDLARVPLPDKDSDLHLFDKPKVKPLRVVTSKSGTSAWLAAEIATRVKHAGKWTAQTVRASGYLVLDGTTWRVRAADLSVAVPDEPPPPMCGAMNNQFVPEPGVPKAMAPTIRALLEAMNESKTLVAMISDDKGSLLFGSAPKELYSGGASIKAIFKKWEIGATISKDTKDEDLEAIAGGDAELAWAIVPVMGPYKLCTMYRGFFVLAKESSGWKIVHQHYSSPFGS